MKSARGFSLAEVVVSIFLLGLVLTAVFNLFPASMLGLDNSRARYQASELAQTRLERRAAEISGSSWTEIPDNLPVQESSQEFQQSLGAQSFQGQVVTERSSAYLRKVTVRVSWTARGVTHTVEEACFVSALRR